MRSPVFGVLYKDTPAGHAGGGDFVRGRDGQGVGEGIPKLESTGNDKEKANTFLYPYGYLASREEGIRSLNDSISENGPEVKTKSP